ncbi:MAG: hypothetical protein FWB95_04730 [Treponema sp.]|nr:hypothetical protein [Treponema sp.]
MQKKSLNQFYNSYRSGDMERENFEGAIYTFLVNNQEKTCISHWNNDLYEDFVSWFYPRLKKSIDNYQEMGASFEAFLGKYMLLSAKEFQIRATTNSITEYSAWSAQIPEMYVYEEAPVYTHNNAQEIISNLIIDRSGRKNTRRILALIIKCYCCVSDNFAERIAPLIGMSSKELIKLLDEIREMRQEKDDRIFRMKERSYCQYYRCIVYEKRLIHTRENTSEHERLKFRLEKARERLEKMRKRISAIRTDATNKQVAEILGIAKGTVDANLHRLKTRWEIMSKKAELN